MTRRRRLHLALPTKSKPAAQPIAWREAKWQSSQWGKENNLLLLRALRAIDGLREFKDIPPLDRRRPYVSYADRQSPRTS